MKFVRSSILYVCILRISEYDNDRALRKIATRCQTINQSINLLLRPQIGRARFLNSHSNTQRSPKPSNSSEKAQQTAPGSIKERINRHRDARAQDSNKKPNPHKYVLLRETRAVSELDDHDEVGHDGEDAAGDVEPEVCV
jgi:hypothetical protein